MRGRYGIVVLLGLLALVYGALRWVGIDPQDRRPGTRISGQPAVLPQNLAELAGTQEVTLETRPWFGVPFSVTTVLAEGGGRLFVPSIYDSVQAFPGSKYWNHVVQQNPEVRLRVAGRIYEMAIYPTTTDESFREALAALGRKYPFWAQQAPMERSSASFALLQLVPRGEAPPAG